MRPDKFDPEVLDAALVVLIDQAQTTRDCFLTGDEAAGLQSFELVIHSIAEAVHQISLFNRK
jgi:hypothetical protein